MITGKQFARAVAGLVALISMAFAVALVVAVALAMMINVVQWGVS